MNDEFAFALGLARAKLNATRPRAGRPMAALAAAAFFCLSAMTFAAAAILAPSNVTTPAARTGVQ